MWIAIDGGPHKMYVDVCKLETIYVSHVSYSNYKVVGTLGDRDLCLKSKLPTEAEAQEWLDGLIKQAMS